MVRGKQLIQHGTSLPYSVLIGLSFCTVISAILIAVAAYLISAEMIEEGALVYCAMGILFLSSLAGTWISVKWSKKKRIVTGLVTGAAYYLCLIGITALFFEGRYRALSETALLIFGAVGVVILMGLRPEKQRYSRHRKKQY